MGLGVPDLSETREPNYAPKMQTRGVSVNHTNDAL